MLSVLAATFVLAACGGGGGGGSTSAPTPRAPVNNGGDSSQEPTWQAGVFPAQSTFKDFCATPRSGIDSFSGEAFPDNCLRNSA